MRTSRFLRAACIFLTGALAATLWWGYLFLGHAREDAIRAVDEFNAETERMAAVCDRPIPGGGAMRPRLQDGPQRANAPYAGGTVGDSGGDSQRARTGDGPRGADRKHFYGIGGGLHGAQRN